MEHRRDRRCGCNRNALPCAVEDLEQRLCLSTTFTSPTNFGGIASPTGIATGDFNGDGKPDLVIAGTDTSVDVPVIVDYLDGNFNDSAESPLVGTTAGVVTGNFQGDGTQDDVAAIDSANNTLNVFLNADDGEGDLYADATVSLVGSGGDTQIVSADFNGDHKDDVAVLDPDNGSVDVFTGNGDGTFSFDQSIFVPSPINVAVGDFNGDGHPDLAVLSSNGSVYVALNTGGGAFAAPTAYSFANDFTTVTGFAAPVLTSSGRSDLVVIGTIGLEGGFATALSQSNGTFTLAAPTSLSITPDVVLADDFTTSGFTDLAMLSSDGSLQILPGNGDGTFQAPQTIFSGTLGSGITQAVVANFDGAPGIAYISPSIQGFSLISDTSVATQDLSPTLSGTLPTSAISGVSFTAHENLALTASGSAVNGTASATLLLSPDTSAADSVLTLGSTGGRVVLKAGKSKTFSVKLAKSIPTSVTPGLYHVLVQLTDTNGLTATVDSGKIVNVAAPVVDLTGSFVKPPATVKAGKRFAVTLLVTNTSSANVAAIGRLPLEIESTPDGSLADASPLLTVTKPINLKPGKSVRITFTATLTAAAYLYVNLDPQNVVFPNDLDPSNNLFSTASIIAVG